MKKQQQPTHNTTTDLGELAEPIGRIAAKLAEVSAELDQLSEQIRTQRTGAESVRRPDPDREPEEQPPRPAGATMGEPVDTSYTNPPQTPAASAAGALPSGSSGSGPVRWTTERMHVIAWVGSGIILLGIFVLLLVFARM